MLSSTSTTGPTTTSSDVSSRTSRSSAPCSVSPISTAPPGRLHSPLSGSCPRCTSSTRSASRITAPTATNGRSGYVLKSSSPRVLNFGLPHHLEDHALFPPPVELGVEDLLPRSEIELAGGDRHHHLVPHNRPFQVRIGVVLTGPVVCIVESGRRQLLEPDLKIANQSIFPVVHENA